GADPTRRPHSEQNSASRSWRGPCSGQAGNPEGLPDGRGTRETGDGMLGGGSGPSARSAVNASAAYFAFSASESASDSFPVARSNSISFSARNATARGERSSSGSSPSLPL